MTLLRKFHRLLLPLAIFFCVTFNAHAQTTVIVSGDIKSVFAGTPPVDARVKICFKLTDVNGQSVANPRVPGVGAITQDNVCTTPSSGHYSVTLYGNDVVSVGGVTGVTKYSVQFQLNNSYTHGADYVLNTTDSPVDLNTKADLSTAPPATPINADTVYLRKDGSNNPIATLAVAGNAAVGGNETVGGNVAATGSVTGSNIPSGTINTGTGTTNAVPKFASGTAGTFTNSALTDNGTTLSSSENFSAPNIPANIAVKNSSSDHTIYLSSAGNDSNDGLSWGTAKLTVQAAFNTATTSGTNPGNVVAACGTYAGPTTWYSNILFWGWGSSDATGDNFGVSPFTAVPCVKVTYSSTVTLTSIQNTFIRNIYFEFANSGAGIVLNSVTSTHFDDVIAHQCGNATTPCVLMKTIGTGGPAQHTMLNVFRGFHCIANNGGSGANATCIKMLGQGSVNCVGACGAVTLNRFYNTICAGGVLHCIDFELNTDSNYFYDVNCNQDVPLSGSSCVSFNELTPASDQDADGEYISNLCATGTFSALIRAGQTTGSQLLGICNGASGIPPMTVLGGTPQFSSSTIGLPGTTPATVIYGTFAVSNQANYPPPSGCGGGCGYFAGNLVGGNIQANQFATPTASNFTLSAGFGTGATVTGIVGSGMQTVLFNITAGTTPSANPTITYTYPNAYLTAPACDATQHGGTGTNTIFSAQALSTTASTFQFAGTPVAGSIYTVLRALKRSRLSWADILLWTVKMMGAYYSWHGNARRP